MTNALDLALANAAANAPKGEELHLENLDAIANPEREEVILHQYDPKADNQDIGAVYNSNSFSARNGYQQPLPDSLDKVRTQHLNSKTHFVNNPEQDGLILLNIKAVLSEMPLIKLRLDALADMITEMHLTIQNAKQSMPSEPNLKHRSLDEWGDSTLLNELVERENDLMPFYYELLKRIGSPELQSLVMSSMQGKNASMVTLAQLCSALAPTPQQSRPVYEAGISPSAEQRMDEAFHAATTPQTYTQAQLDNLRFNGQSSGITVEEIALYEKMKRNSSPSYPATIPSMPPTYNPFFKEQ